MLLEASSRKATAWWLASFILLSLVFASGVLKTNALPSWFVNSPTKPVNTRPNFDSFNEVMTTNVIDTTLLGLENSKGFLFQIPNSGKADPRVLDIQRPDLYRPDWIPGRNDLAKPAEYYRSQIGLQGRSYALAARSLNLPREQTYTVLRTFSAVALAAMLSVLIAFLYLQWGWEAAAASLAFCTLSTGFNLFSWSLHWVAFLQVAPTALMAALAMTLPSRSIVRPALFFGLFAIILIVKLASGYEFYTTTLAATVIPFFVVYATGRIPMKTLVAYSTVAISIGIIAFAATLAIFNVLYLDAFGESGLAWLSQRTTNWATQAGTGVYGQLVDVAKVAAINSIDIAGYGLPNGLLGAIALPFLFIAAKALATGKLNEEKARVAIVISAAFMASASWILLQFHHVSFHSRFSTILISFPFGIFLFAGIGRIWHLHRQRAPQRPFEHTFSDRELSRGSV